MSDRNGDDAPLVQSWFYTSDVAFAGGGKRLPEPARLGMVGVMADGRVSIQPDDDYYSGELTLEESIALARLVLARAGVGVREATPEGRREIDEFARSLACPKCGKVHIDECPKDDEVACLELRVTFDREEDGRWIAIVRNLPGVMQYGDTREQARQRVHSLALSVFSDWVKDGGALAQLQHSG